MRHLDRIRMVVEHGKAASDIGLVLVFRHYPEVTAVFKGAVPAGIIVRRYDLRTAREVSDLTVGHDRVLRDHPFLMVHTVGEFIPDHREYAAGIHYDLRPVFGFSFFWFPAPDTGNEFPLQDGFDHFRFR